MVYLFSTQQRSFVLISFFSSFPLTKKKKKKAVEVCSVMIYSPLLHVLRAVHDANWRFLPKSAEAVRTRFKRGFDVREELSVVGKYY